MGREPYHGMVQTHTLEDIGTGRDKLLRNSLVMDTSVFILCYLRIAMVLRGLLTCLYYYRWMGWILVR